MKLIKSPLGLALGLGLALAADLGVDATTFGVAALGLLGAFLTATFLAGLAAADLVPPFALVGAFLAAFKAAGLAFNFFTADMLFVSGLK
ncbi:MAG: hypothetical protein P8164_01660 [Gammaproteobacteria bacterium]